MYCKNCGNEVNNGASFCNKCGAKVDVQTPVTPAPAAATPVTPVAPAAPATPANQGIIPGIPPKFNKFIPMAIAGVLLIVMLILTFTSAFSIDGRWKVSKITDEDGDVYYDIEDIEDRDEIRSIKFEKEKGNVYKILTYEGNDRIDKEYVKNKNGKLYNADSDGDIKDEDAYLKVDWRGFNMVLKMVDDDEVGGRMYLSRTLDVGFIVKIATFVILDLALIAAVILLFLLKDKKNIKDVRINDIKEVVTEKYNDIKDSGFVKGVADKFPTQNAPETSAPAQPVATPEQENQNFPQN